MKNKSIKGIIILSVAGILVALAACKKDFDKLNTSPNSPSSYNTAYLLTGAEKGLIDNNWDRWWNGGVGMLLAQYYSQNDYPQEQQYLFRTGITANYWDLQYAGGANALSVGSTVFTEGGIKSLQQIIDLCNKDPKSALANGNTGNQKAVAEIMEVWAFQNITDVWGDVPFSEALKDVENTQPKYDKQRDIYLGLLNMLDSANKWMDVTQSGPTGDQIYSGDMLKWQKFSNSLKVRVAMRIADREPTIASTRVQEAVNAPGGVFTSNDDNAVFKYQSSAPSYNPLYYDRLVTGRVDYSSANTIVDVMNTLNDTLRLATYFDRTADDGTFTGRPYGQSASQAATTPNSSVSQPSGDASGGADGTLSPTAPGVYLDYAQIEFFLAEAVERGIPVGGSASSHYENGINASFIFWTGQPAPSDYLAQPSVDYAAQQGAGKTFRQIIGQQKWLALYMQGMQGWIEWRRLDFGILQIPVGGVREGTGIPTRLKYPYNESALNPTGYSGALSSQGADQQDTKVWWDAQ